MLANSFLRISPFRLISWWLAAYVVANIASLLVLSVLGYSGAEDLPTWVLAVSALTLWVPFMVMLRALSKRSGSGSVRRDFAISFTARDLWGLPLGLLSQLVVVVAVTIPFNWLFPSVFNSENVEKRAKGLFDAASGGWMVVLVLVVVFGAPFVEEVIYRGFIQQYLGTSIGKISALIVSSLWFAGIHFQVAEFPGLFAFSIVLGVSFMRTQRLGLAIVTHIAFNATALAALALTQYI